LGWESFLSDDEVFGFLIINEEKFRRKDNKNDIDTSIFSEFINKCDRYRKINKNVVFALILPCIDFSVKKTRGDQSKVMIFDPIKSDIIFIVVITNSLFFRFNLIKTCSYFYLLLISSLPIKPHVCSGTFPPFLSFFAYNALFSFKTYAHNDLR
jgi:hypothetical protein